MAIDFTKAAEMLAQADRSDNPIGTVRTAAMTPPSDGELSIDSLPGTWKVMRKWEQGHVWMHEIRRVR
jgi:hypothetical protein